MSEEILTRSVQAEGQNITYCLERKPVKNLNLRIRKDGSIYVSANDQVSPEEADDFVLRKSGFVLNAVNQFHEMEQYKPQPKRYVSGESFYLLGHGLRLVVSKDQRDSVTSDGVFLYLKVKDPEDFEKKQRMVTRYLDRQCRQVFQEELDRLYPLFQKYGVAEPKLRIREMDTRWGSCLAKKGIVTLNKRLLEAPQNCIEYVVMHELCHFIHPNHSKQFYQFLTMMMPDWRQRKEALDKSAEYWL